jgi:hypothetical protein
MAEAVDTLSGQTFIADAGVLLKTVSNCPRYRAYIRRAYSDYIW